MKFWKRRRPAHAPSRNAVAGVLMEQYGYVPLSVRYKAAEAACRIVEQHIKQREERAA